MTPVIPLEEKAVANGRQEVSGKRSRSGAGVLHQHGACVGSVTLPELGTMSPVVCHEINGAADIGQVRRVGRESAGANVFHLNRARVGSVRLPQLIPILL